MFQIELYSAMMGVVAAAKRDRVPGPLQKTMLSIARGVSLLDEKSAVRYARVVLKGPTNLRVVCGHLPELTAEAILRLIRLLEYVSNG